MRQPPTYAGTRGRAPCPVCEGTGYESFVHDGRGRRFVCIACNGTKVQPISKPVAAARASARIAGIRRAQETR